MLKILVNLSLDTRYKGDRFSKTLLKKSYKFVPNKKDTIIAFNLDFALLLVEADPILKQQGRKVDILGACRISNIEIIFLLSTKKATLYMGATIGQVRILGFYFGMQSLLYHIFSP